MYNSQSEMLSATETSGKIEFFILPLNYSTQNNKHKQNLIQFSFYFFRIQLEWNLIVPLFLSSSDRNCRFSINVVQKRQNTL